jgi:hypothetical protein
MNFAPPSKNLFDELLVVYQIDSDSSQQNWARNKKPRSGVALASGAGLI